MLSASCASSRWLRFKNAVLKSLKHGKGMVEVTVKILAPGDYVFDNRVVT